MNYRGPGFLAIVWFGSFPLPYPTTHRGLRKRDNLLTGEGCRGEERSQFIWRRKSLVLYNTLNTLWGELTIVSKTYHNNKRIMDPLGTQGCSKLWCSGRKTSSTVTHTQWHNNPRIPPSLPSAGTHTGPDIYHLGLSFSVTTGLLILIFLLLLSIDVQHCS